MRLIFSVISSANIKDRVSIGKFYHNYLPSIVIIIKTQVTREAEIDIGMKECGTSVNIY